MLIPDKTFSGQVSSLNSKIDAASRMLAGSRNASECRTGRCCRGCISSVSVASGAAAVSGHHPAGGGGVQSVRRAGLCGA